MNIQKKSLLFLMFFYFNNQAPSNTNTFDIIESNLENISPFASFLKAITIASIGYLTNNYIENRLNHKEEKNNENRDSETIHLSDTDSQLSQIERKVMKKIISKLSINISGSWMNGLYTNIFLPSSVSNIIDNPYLSGSIKNLPIQNYKNLSILANELRTFGSFFQLFGDFQKCKKSIDRLTKRFTKITIQSLMTSFGFALAYKSIMDTLKKSVETKLDKISWLNNKPYSKDGIGVITTILCDLLIMTPLIEHYIIPTGHLCVNHFTKKTSNFVKWQNISFIAKATKQNFYEYENSEEILDTRDMYNCLKYTETISKCIKNCKFLPFYKYIPFLF